MSNTTQGPIDTVAGVETLTDGEYHRLMAAERRRMTVAALDEATPPVDLEDLAAAVAERDPEVDATTRTAVSRIAAELHHVHLPKMDALGLIDYTPNSNRVRSAF